MQKNVLLNDYLWFLLNEINASMPAHTFRIITPEHRYEKGCQVSLAVNNGKAVFDFLSQEGVFADWREPDVIRVAPVGLYNSYEEVWQFAQLFSRALHTFAL